MIKQHARDKMKKVRDDMTELEISKHSKRIMEQVMGFEPFLTAKQILTYVSFSHEVDTTIWIQDILNEKHRNKQIFVPRIINNQMEFMELSTYDQLQRGYFGILEPKTDGLNRYEASPIEKDVHPVMLLPGLAFDLHGNRVGYGRGFYDRYLDCFQEDHFIKIALAFECQIVDEIETTSNDRRVDYIVTEKQIYNCNN